MYAFLWRHLPGSRRTRVALAVLLVAGIGALLWYVIYPVIDDWLPVDAAVSVGGS